MLPVVSSYHGNPAAAQTFGQTSPAAQAAASRNYQQATSPGPNGHGDIYNHSSNDQGYVQTTSPQPNGFQTLTINRVSWVINIFIIKIFNFKTRILFSS